MCVYERETEIEEEKKRHTHSERDREKMIRLEREFVCEKGRGRGGGGREGDIMRQIKTESKRESNRVKKSIYNSFLRLYCQNSRFFFIIIMYVFLQFAYL